MDKHENRFSQLVISESAASCMAENFAISPIGHLDLNQTSINELFYSSRIKFDTTSYAIYIPIFE